MPVYKNYANKWNDDRGLDDYRDNKREAVSRRGRNTPMHEEGWIEGDGSHEENYGLGDTSQGSANYGHIDEGNGARYYGTGNYGGYFGRGSDEDDNRRYGPHHGKGPKGYTRSDEKIKEDVQERLYHDSFIDASDIEVSVNDGEVTLSGTVDHKQTRRRAEDCADSVSGVKNVSLNLKINRTSGSASSSEV